MLEAERRRENERTIFEGFARGEKRKEKEEEEEARSGGTRTSQG